SPPHFQARWARMTSVAAIPATAVFVRIPSAVTPVPYPRMRVRLIANPNASGVDRTLVDRVGAELGPAGDLEVALTEHAGHAVELAGLPGADVVVVLGGDGTANEVVNGLSAGAALGVLPGGATSVF